MLTDAGGERVVLCPITDDDIDQVAAFLRTTMPAGVDASDWAAAMRPPWRTPQPNHGFMLVQADRVVGAYLALYSERKIEGRTELFCNLAAWSVLDDYRVHSIRLLRAFLKQKDYHFTDLSPSGNVSALNERFGFSYLDNHTTIVPCLPWPFGGSITVIADEVALASVLTGDALRIHLDHRGTAAHQVAVTNGDRVCLVVFRHERLKRLRLFATVLYASDPDLFHEGMGRLGSHLLRSHGIVGLLVERRIAGGRAPKRSLPITPPRPRMYRTSRLSPEQVDYLYSELTCVAW